ncbi:DUF58 domain-containing protein [Labedella populi]|uniref:DUF58 domain-containing protein n=1 Tax=Labedella populi TaxID=2498850 RepID=A0A444QAM9_9MICO|nr:DUF58 domain-containing protein [Labedella populi]RWZ61132.1 DUF58 domain-containing protein [Labedella populi]
MLGRSVVTPSRSWRLTPRGWAIVVVALLVFAAAVVSDRREGFVVAVFLVTLLAVAGVFVGLRRPRLVVSRRLPSDLLAVGEDVDVVLTVGTDSWEPSISRWRDVVPESFGATPTGPNSDPARASDAGVVRSVYSVRPRRRGEFVLGPLVVTQADPFGLVEADRSSDGRNAVMVTPRVSPLVRSDLVRASGEGTRHEHRMSSHPRIDELIAREYRSGDPMRRIHWRATARRGELMVRQEEQEVDPAVVLLLDTGASLDGSPAPTPTVFEQMVDLAASISAHVLDDGFRLTLVESTPREAAAAERFEPAHAADVLRRLALVSPTGPADDDPGIAAVSRDVLDRAGGAVPFVVLLADAGIATVRRLVPLARLADPAIAFVPPGTASVDGAELLRSAGWIVGVVDPERPVEEIWNDTMLVDRGRPEGVI